MSELKIWVFSVKESDYDYDVDGIVITDSEEKAWKIFIEDHLNPYTGKFNEYGDEEYYSKDNWNIRVEELKEYSHWNSNNG
ncbi:MAG: hypothetical protein MUO31_00920 [Thermodesulfovibrionales bacterium]|nr:hypothetical protein [Thermodesulfovibrionales bacterium]